MSFHAIVYNNSVEMICDCEHSDVPEILDMSCRTYLKERKNLFSGPNFRRNDMLEITPWNSLSLLKVILLLLFYFILLHRSYIFSVRCGTFTAPSIINCSDYNFRVWCVWRRPSRWGLPRTRTGGRRGNLSHYSLVEVRCISVTYFRSNGILKLEGNLNER